MSYTPDRKCSREGCSRRANSGRETCSALCTAVVAEMSASQRVVEAIGTPDGELWATAVGLNDAVSAFRTADAEVYSAARRVGITSQQFQAIKRGTVAG